MSRSRPTRAAVAPRPARARAVPASARRIAEPDREVEDGCGTVVTARVTAADAEPKASSGEETPKQDFVSAQGGLWGRGTVQGVWERETRGPRQASRAGSTVPLAR